jgi:hypothetical protein
MNEETAKPAFDPGRARRVSRGVPRPTWKSVLEECNGNCLMVFILVVTRRKGHTYDC